MSKLIYITDRSRIDARRNCRRKRYLNYDFTVDGEPMGIQRRSASLPLLNGTEGHNVYARVLAHEVGLAGGMDIPSAVALMKADYRSTVEKKGVFMQADAVSEEASLIDVDEVKRQAAERENLIREQTTLLEGMLWAFKAIWIPRILEDYDIIGIEKPMDWELHPGLVQKLRFDVTARRKADGHLIILDYKTMKYLSDAWALKLEHSKQTSLYTEAAEELYGEPVEMGYIGVITGPWKKDTAKSSPFYQQKIQASPLLYAYAFHGDVGTVYQTDYTPKKGYRKVRTYEEMPIKEWVRWMWHNERQNLNDLFVFNPPISPTPRARKRTRELVVREELEYWQNIRRYEEMKLKALETGNDELLQKAEDFLDFVAAPMDEDSCFMYGSESRCQFYDICHNEGALEYALEDGGFEKRQPHHSTELEEAA